MRNSILFIFVCLVSILLTSCKPVSRITTGEDAYQYKRYPQAVSMLTAEVEKTSFEDEQARKSYWIGESYRLMNQDVASIAWYRKAYELSKNKISLEAYAYAVFRSQQYSNAKKLFLKLSADYGKSEAWENAIKSCDAALIWIAEQDVNQYVITKARFNSAQSDYSPAFFGDILVFTSDRIESKGDEYHWTGNQFTDFYRTQENPKLDALLYKINSPFNEAAIAFNSRNDHVVYTQCGSVQDDADLENCRLIEGFWSEEDNTWIKFKKLSFCQEDVSYGHPTFFNQDRAIIFSSNDPKGIGGRDLWVSYYNDGNWSSPILLPQGINTFGNESFPNMQGDTLFYSSDGMIGMGGLDLYFSKWLPPDGWTPPINMKPPINSGGDDFGYTNDVNFRKDNSTLKRFYISSNRNGSQLDDIYVFEEKNLKKTDTSTDEVSYDIVIEGKVLEHIYEEPGNPNSRIMGTRPLAQAEVSIDKKSQFPTIQVDETGEFRYKLKEEGPYRFSANRSDYLSNSNYLDVKLTEKDKSVGTKTYIVHIVLDPIVYNKEIVLENIYYDFDKWEIRKDAEPSLQELSELLINNPKIKIELASHTDCRGLEIYNAELSQRRAQSAVAYLKSLGIAGQRMQAVGYGEQRPSVECECELCTEEQHQANRRTTFTILKN
jgi:outer membrane protein OmpA-like peptidoglycan-associated protein/tetratricopeptide (TPR) repeat protein